MDVREKLVELLKRTDREVYEALKDREDYREEMLWDYFASNLIANGVTFANDNNVGDKLTPIADKLSATEWISVKDRLPKPWADVLVFYEDKTISMDAMSDGGKWYSDYVSTNKVTHWMPLPEPPKGE